MPYRVQGNLDASLVMPVFNQTDLSSEELFRFLPERSSTKDGYRELPLPIPDWFRFVLQPREDARGQLYCLDAMGTVAGGFGIETFLTETAVRRIQPYLKDECQFFEVPMNGTPERYFGMWVTRIIDALDYQRSKASEARYLPKKGPRHPLQLYSYDFRPERRIDGFLFRLPGRDLSEASMYDYATDDFLDLVRKLRITGFQFSKNAQDRPIEPVPAPSVPSATRH